MYLSLVFILLISFAGAMLESASLQNVKNYRRADMTRAVESIFAEYQKELWEVYGIFALEGSYETGSYNEELLKERLELACGRVEEVAREHSAAEPFGEYFRQMAGFLLEMITLREERCRENGGNGRT